jgi:hypothetical protein
MYSSTGFPHKTAFVFKKHVKENNVYLRLLGESRVEYLVLSNISANIAVALKMATKIFAQLSVTILTILNPGN